MKPAPVLCLPYAGAGATFYRGWPAGPPGITVVALQLAGREERFGEDTYPDLAAAVDDLGRAAAPFTATGEPYLLFGHSFGAVLAFEVTRWLCAQGLPAPARLVVSGSAAPGRPLGRCSAGLADDEFVARIAQLAGYVHPALADPDLRELVLPVLRADVELHESYRPRDTEPVPVPITAVRGIDDHLVTARDCRAWGDWTRHGCTVHELPGGHMHLATHPLPVLELLAEPARPALERQ